MHESDRMKAIKLMRSIAALAAECARTLESKNCTTLLAETHSLIEGDMEKISALELWTDLYEHERS